MAGQPGGVAFGGEAGPSVVDGGMICGDGEVGDFGGMVGAPGWVGVGGLLCDGGNALVACLDVVMMLLVAKLDPQDESALAACCDVAVRLLAASLDHQDVLALVACQALVAMLLVALLGHQDALVVACGDVVAAE
ncbi:hypothetical protein RJ639_044417 [Escallonia herrerae]|uniref:Uncharacterized protein n=1 Tax=Escallonia herrerae TaxID=1293975 RepID=A0AA89B712_9ASTE|nr:hypothetical protein RJ639_044417 [Escallonia herrerae]